jgi:hypothetical protein
LQRRTLSYVKPTTAESRRSDSDGSILLQEGRSQPRKVRGWLQRQIGWLRWMRRLRHLRAISEHHQPAQSATYKAITGLNVEAIRNILYIYLYRFNSIVIQLAVKKAHAFWWGGRMSGVAG